MNTLLPWQERCAYAQVANACLMTKVQLLEDQFTAAGFDFVGIQEGRAPAAQSKEGHSYTMLTAPAYEDGSCGVQLWARLGVRVKTWEAYSPRLMFAIICKRGVDFGVIVGHAPHSAAPKESRDAWWDALSSKCTKLRTSYDLEWFVLLDANGKVGSVPSPMIGPVSPEREKENGMQLRLFADDHEMMVSNTWGPESGFTWTSSKGTRSRIDYVIQPFSLERQVHHSRPSTILV